MNTDQILAEIREANLSYLMLSQRLIQADCEQALDRLGITTDVARLLEAMSPAQMMKIAAGNTLLCRMQVDDDMVWQLLGDHGKLAANEGAPRLRAVAPVQGGHHGAV